jgi:perosamine synthetase
MIPHSRPMVGEEEAQAMAAVLASGNLAQGREVEAFEKETAAFLGRRYGIAVNSGTAALHLALMALGVHPEDSVAVPSYACASLTQAIAWQRAHPVLCEIDKDFNLDPAKVPAEVRAVVVPHLFGATAALPQHGCVVEDLAQAFGGTAGKEGIVAITSFYATKLLTTGEGGMVFTDDEGIAAFVRDRRDYDNRDDFQIRFAYKMTEFQAAMGRVQLKRLPDFLARRQEIGARYHEGLRHLPVVLPRQEDHLYFRFVLSTPEGPQLIQWLREHGVGASRPVHRPAHHTLGGRFDRSEEAHLFNVSIPIYPAMTGQEVEYVVECVVQYYDEMLDSAVKHATPAGGVPLG